MDVSGTAILAWLVAGTLAWRKHGLAEPAVVREASAALRVSMNPMHDFFATHCVFERGAFAASKSIETVYKQWADDHGVPARDRIGYKRRATYLRRQGASDRGADGLGIIEGRQVRGWSGIRLVDAEGGNLF